MTKEAILGMMAVLVLWAAASLMVYKLLEWLNNGTKR